MRDPTPADQNPHRHLVQALFTVACWMPHLTAIWQTSVLITAEANLPTTLARPDERRRSENERTHRMPFAGLHDIGDRLELDLFRHRCI